MVYGSLHLSHHARDARSREIKYQVISVQGVAHTLWYTRCYADEAEGEKEHAKNAALGGPLPPEETGGRGCLSI